MVCYIIPDRGSAVNARSAARQCLSVMVTAGFCVLWFMLGQCLQAILGDFSHGDATMQH